MAVLGHGKEHFDFKNSMVPTGEPFSTPLYKIGVLLEELRLVNKERPDKPLDKVIMETHTFVRHTLRKSIVNNETFHIFCHLVSYCVLFFVCRSM